MNKLLIYKRKKLIKIFFVPFRKEKELIKEIDLSSNNIEIDEVETIFFESVMRVCGFDVDNEEAYLEFCKEFWNVDFFDVEDINQCAAAYNLMVIANGFGRGSMASAIVSELSKKEEK